MKTIASFITSSLLAFTLVTAQSAVIQQIPSPIKLSIPPSSPSQEEIISFQQELEKNPEDQSKPVILKLHENNNGAKVTVPSGSLVKVILATQSASTGSDWAPTFSSPDVLEFKHKKIKQAPRPLIGAPAQECWTFIATAPGQTTLTFSLARSWEKEATPLKTVHFDITVE
ncbi:MAG: protease inhibitor I42 family protein [Chthoniobacterales bacterium]|nr:protease inhibitor I42 family protein [Chthoniobacterales bacterium]